VRSLAGSAPLLAADPAWTLAAWHSVSA
jgi:hypothetical protein